MKETILVVDDDEKIVQMLSRALRFEGYQVSTASNGEEALRFVDQVRPDLILLDVMMPKLDGWEVCRRIRNKDTKLPILMLTAKDEVENRIKGLDIGADDYIIKPFHLEELLARIRAHIRRTSTDHESNKLIYKDIILNADARKAWRNTRELELKGKEFDILAFFLQHPEQVLSKEQILEHVWGPLYDGESNIVEVYIASLRQKLERNGEPRVIETIRGVGYVLRGE